MKTELKRLSGKLAEPKFTPGPWSIFKAGPFWFIRSDTKTKKAYHVFAKLYGISTESDAHLIATAPDMYDDLIEIQEFVLSVLDNNNQNNLDWKTIINIILGILTDKNSIAKAEGKEGRGDDS